MALSRIPDAGVAALAASKLTGQVITENIADEAISIEKLSVQSTPLGVNQTWQDVRANRAAATTYTNSTGRPIMVSVTAGVNTYSYIFGIVNGIVITEHQSRDANTSTSQASVIFVVPAGSTYAVNVNVNANTTSIDNWFELR